MKKREINQKRKSEKEKNSSFLVISDKTQIIMILYLYRMPEVCLKGKPTRGNIALKSLSNPRTNDFPDKIGLSIFRNPFSGQG